MQEDWDVGVKMHLSTSRWTCHLCSAGGMYAGQLALSSTPTLDQPAVTAWDLHLQPHQTPSSDWLVQDSQDSTPGPYGPVWCHQQAQQDA